jgi:hypothetical protein
MAGHPLTADQPASSDMATIRRSRKSTVVRYLTLVPGHPGFPTQPASYLSRPAISLALPPSAKRRCCLPERMPCSPGGDSAAGPCPHCGHASPLHMPHAMLECTAWDAPRHQLWQGITDVAGAAEVKRVQALPPAEQVGALLRTTVLVGVGVPV